MTQSTDIVVFPAFGVVSVLLLAVLRWRQTIDLRAAALVTVLVTTYMLWLSKKFATFDCDSVSVFSTLLPATFAARERNRFTIGRVLVVQGVVALQLYFLLAGRYLAVNVGQAQFITIPEYPENWAAVVVSDWMLGISWCVVLHIRLQIGGRQVLASSINILLLLVLGLAFSLARSSLLVFPRQLTFELSLFDYVVWEGYAAWGLAVLSSVAFFGLMRSNQEVRPAQ